MPARSARRVGLAVALVACVSTTFATAVTFTAAPPASAATGYHEYVALGDSYTADSALTWPSVQFVPFGCAQSTDDYPHQVAAALGVADFTDASCGGATTDDMTQPQSTPLGTNTPQSDRLTPTTDLVTLGIGGNDAGFIGYVSQCENSNPDPSSGNCADTLTTNGVDQISQSIAAAEPKIATVLAQIHQRSPQARVFVVNYLDGLPLTGTAATPRSTSTTPTWPICRRNTSSSTT
ncbi:MAG: hypothetical protein JWQ81_1270 [Amycolatopsis sp.]|uniref:SGNH/GDSL hydrolase family protein n=1 Tax=Amycolatopsis sp. TaxID=37632 RepID=UPI002636D545|nr:SGNH/GDSL hydrolase family protein [Amycolatopsis sp.]MCU1680531.1 hypothetical protein [Amycolatopsis sp.]